MQKIEEAMRSLALEKLQKGEVNRVIGWKKGESFYDISPATFTLNNMDGFVYNRFCGANLSKYLIEESKKEGKTLVFLKPCDSYSYNQLLSEHRIDGEKILTVCVECQGMCDESKLGEGVLSVQEKGDKLLVETLYGKKEVPQDNALLIKCETCKSKEFAVGGEKIVFGEMKDTSKRRFEEVEKLEKMTEEERYVFWQDQLSKCIRCNACRNVCPACNCTHCVFDTPTSGVAAKSNADKFEEQLFHIIRAYHVAGRCTDCGECSRVCPQNIPLHLINRKVIKDLNENYGTYQAGSKVTGLNPVVDFRTDDVEASTVVKGDKK